MDAVDLNYAVDAPPAAWLEMLLPGWARLQVTWGAAKLLLPHQRPAAAR